MTKTLVIYHKNCPDGFGAAWVAWKKFGNRAEYVAVAPEELPKTFPKGRRIYAIDVSYEISVQERLRKYNPLVVVIDHHASRRIDTEHFPENVFDNNHSAAVLAWKYFFPKKPVPRMLKYVEEGDLWKMTLPRVHDVLPYLYMQDRMFTRWSEMARTFQTAKGFTHYASLGKIAREYEDSVIKDLVERAEAVFFEGLAVPAVNNSSRRFTSAVGDILSRKKPNLTLIWYEGADGIKVSLRSNGTVDVSKIALKYGGGGHKNASSFMIKTAKKPWKKLGKKWI